MDLKIAENTSDYQKKVLAEGFVTQVQYEEAMFATWQCLIDQGFKPDEPFWSKGQLRFDHTIVAASMEDLSLEEAKYDVAYEDCEQEFSSEVANQWVNQNAYSEEERDGVKHEIIEYLNEVGLIVAPDAKHEDIYQVIAESEDKVWEPCLKDKAGYLTVPN